MDPVATPENQTARAKPALKKASKKPARGGARPGAGRPRKAPAAPRAPTPEATAPSSPEASTAPTTEQPAASSAPPIEDAFGPRAATDPHAELRRKIARIAPELAPITTGMLAPVLASVVLHATGCDLSRVTVRARVISRSGEPRSRECDAVEGLGLALAQLGAAIAPDVGEWSSHPLAPAAVTLGAVATVVAAHVLTERMGGDPQAFARVASEAARDQVRAEAPAASAAEAPSTIPADPEASGVEVRA